MVNHDLSEINNAIQWSVKHHSTIGYIFWSKHQVEIIIDAIHIRSTYKIGVYRNGSLEYEVPAYYKDRNEQSFSVCEVVGQNIESCICTDKEVKVVLSNGVMLKFETDGITPCISFGSVETGHITI